MAKAKRLDAYPASVQQLMGLVDRSPNGAITIRFDSEEEAKAWRFDFYGFRDAVKALNPEWEKDFPSLQGITIKIFGVEVAGEVSWHATAKKSKDDVILERLQRELSLQLRNQQHAGDGPVSTERQDDGELER